METLPFFYFDGEDGCDECKALVGHYAKMPSHPHPECDCEFMVDFLEGEVVYRDHETSESTFEVDGWESFEFHNEAEIEWLFTEDITVSVTGDLSCIPGIEEAFDVAGTYSDEETYTATFQQALAPDETVTVEVTAKYKHVELSAERWFIAQDETEDHGVIEVLMGEISDSIDVPAGISLNVEEGGGDDDDG